MKLEKKYFNQIRFGGKCIFRNSNDKYILCIKFGPGKIFYKDTVKYTGQEHSCYVISNINFIDKLFANCQWYLKKKWAKAKIKEQKNFKNKIRH